MQSKNISHCKVKLQHARHTSEVTSYHPKGVITYKNVFAVNDEKVEHQLPNLYGGKP